MATCRGHDHDETTDEENNGEEETGGNTELPAEVTNKQASARISAARQVHGECLYDSGIRTER